MGAQRTRNRNIGVNLRCLRILLAIAVAALPLLPQQDPPSDGSAEPTIVTTVTQVLAPVTVLDKSGEYVNGLSPKQFRVFDNGTVQSATVDVAFQPISLVIAIQANDHVEGILPKINNIGSLIGPLVIGDQGEAAVLAFDHRLRVLQDFTSDATKIETAIKKITPGSSTSRMIDAVMESVHMLGTRPRNRRRLLLLISETRDRGSEGRVRDALYDVQLRNVSVYSIDISRLASTLTSRPPAPRPDPLPPAMTPLPPNVPATPNTVMQTTGSQGGSADFVPLLVEIFKDTKSIFVDNPAELFTRGSGGTEFSFAKQKGLEDAIAKIGEEIHSQYLISYNPSNRGEGGFHEIRVQVDSPGVRVRTRPGYWLASLK